MKKGVLLSVLLLYAVSVAFAQEPVMADTAQILPSENVHQEYYLVTPQLEYVPGDEPPALVADRLSCIETEFPLIYNETIRGFIDYFTVRDREFTKAILRRKDLYFPIFEKYLAQYGLPDELKYLSIIESALLPAAVSRSKAVGLWQFMAPTGKYYGLHQNWYWDDRMDPEKSTEAACRYLAELHRIFKDWPLALAAYNSGPGTVLRANKRSGYKNNFWEIYPYLPRETRAYVPQFIAMVYTMKYADEHNFHEPNPERYLPSDTLQVASFLNVEVLKQLTGVCQEDFKSLNPQLLTPYIPDNDRTHVIRLPLAAKIALDANRKTILDSASRAGRNQFEALAKAQEEKQYIYHKVRSGNSLGVIARQYGVRTEDIRSWNNLRGNTIHPGQVLKIFVRESQIAKRKSTSPAPARPDAGTSKGLYVVQAGDTLWSIAQQTGQSIEKLRSLNGISGNRLTPGQKLVVR